MSLWKENEEHQAMVKRFLVMSLVWLAIGTISGTLIGLQRLFPWLFEGWAHMGLAQLQLTHISLLLFGFALPFLNGLWFIRLAQLKGSPMLGLPLWEWGNRIWQFAVAWGTFGSLFGFHTDLVFWVWPPVIYGMIAFSGLLIAAAVAINLPKDADHTSSYAIRFLMVGQWSLPTLLGFFLMAYQLRAWTAPSMLQALLFLSVLFPLAGLLLPVSLSHLHSHDAGRLHFSFWACLLFTPLAASSFSAAIPGSFLLFLFQLLTLVAVFVLLYTMAGWWSFPQLFVKHWMTALKIPARGLAFPKDTAATPDTDTTPTPTEWLLHFRYGSICLAVAATEGVVYSLIRLLGYQPSPTWSMSHLYLLLMGAVLLWGQGVLCLLFVFPDEQKETLDAQRIIALGGALLFALGSWWEAGLHMLLEDYGIARGSMFSLTSRGMRAVAVVMLAFAVVWFAQRLFWAIRHVDALPSSSN